MMNNQVIRITTTVLVATNKTNCTEGPVMENQTEKEDGNEMETRSKGGGGGLGAYIVASS